MVRAFEARGRLVTGLLNAIPGIRLAAPRGAIYVFVRVDGFYGKRGGPGGSVPFCEALLDRHRVACVPGLAFGDDRYIRLSYATSEERIRTGIGRIGKFLGGLR